MYILHATVRIQLIEMRVDARSPEWRIEFDLTLSMGTMSGSARFEVGPLIRRSELGVILPR